MPNLDLHPAHEVSNFRKIALGTWATTYDPSVYGTLEVEMDAAMDYLEAWRARTGKRLTVTHLMAKAVAAALQRIPDANAILRFNRPVRRKNIGVFFQVVMTDEGEDKVDLSGATLYDVERKDLTTIVDEFEGKVNAIRTRSDPALEKTRGAFKHVPFVFMTALVKLISVLAYTLNLDMRKVGFPKDPFGSVMVTNVGSLGLDIAYAPLVPYSRVPIVLAVGAAKKIAVVDDADQVVVRKMMKVNATFDHRFIDGYHAAMMSKTIRACFADPVRHFGPLPDAAPESA